MTATEHRAAPFRLPAAWLAVTGAALGVIAAVWQFATWGLDADGWQMAARYTARTSFLLFLLPFIAAPLASLWRGGAVLVRNRRGLGLGFAMAHFVHLGALTGYFVVSGETPAMITALGGGLGYLFVAAMAVTSHDAMVRRMGAKRWKLMHTIGLYYIWFIFAFTYLGRVQAAPEMPEYQILLAVAVGALLFRVAASTLTVMKRRKA
jgi:sulfoxide reductase heme-binding subunit YedZ